MFEFLVNDGGGWGGGASGRDCLPLRLLFTDATLDLAEVGIKLPSLVLRPRVSIPIPWAFLTISSSKDSLDVKVTWGDVGDTGFGRGDVSSLTIGIQLAKISPAVHVMFVGIPITEAVLETRSKKRKHITGAKRF